MQKIELPQNKYLQVGGMELCNSQLPTIHACKQPCYWAAAGRKQLRSGDAGYLAIGRSVGGTPHLYLNLIDPKEPLFYAASFQASLDFLDSTLDNPGYPGVAIHCNQGRSRSASIAFLWLAKREIIPRNWHPAVCAFEKLYPDWNPGGGIQLFIKKNWKELTGGRD